MTDPDPLADLAAQLAELRGQLARSQGEIGVLRERLEAETGQTVMLRLEVKQLREELAEAIEKRQAQAAARAVVARRPGRRPRRCSPSSASGSRRSSGRTTRTTCPAARPAGAGTLEAVWELQHAARRVDPDLRRRGQQGPAGRPRLA